LIGMEDAAKSINEYGNWVVPGLLQTADYARASAAGDAFGHTLTFDAVEQAVHVRARRQEVLDRIKPPMLRVVMDEAVLARTVGGQAVMSAQLAHLEELSTRPRIAIQVIGFRTGIYPGGSRGHYILVHLGADLPDVLYREGIDDPEDRSDAATLAEYWRVWGQVQSMALDLEATRDLLRVYRAKLG
jgi:hypothetical protein